jgi:DNA-binding MarR family transcriptional regulator
MNDIHFGLKRAYQSSMRLAETALAGLGVTPARFEMIYFVSKKRSRLSQRDLQRTLDVSAATVSRMLKSLEALGLVEREVMADRRRRNVVLTEAGRRCAVKGARILGLPRRVPAYQAPSPSGDSRTRAPSLPALPSLH